MKKIKFVILALFAVSCSLFQKEQTKVPCLPEHSEQFTIRWGECVIKDNSFVGYEINAYGLLSLYTKNDKYKDGKTEKITTIDADGFCRTLKIANETIVKTQALYSPGETSKFIEYTNPNNDVFILAVWNPQFQTQGSASYRNLYDSLMALVPSAKALKN